MSLYNLEAFRSQDHRDEMVRLDKAGICIFCPEHIHQDEEKVEEETANWMVKKNRYPREGSKISLLFIPKKHIKTISELDKQAMNQLLALVSKYEKKYKLDSYAIVIRSGDMRYNGGSMEHLHVHLVVGDTDDPNHEPVRYKLSSRPTN